MEFKPQTQIDRVALTLAVNKQLSMESDTKYTCLARFYLIWTRYNGMQIVVTSWLQHFVFSPLLPLPAFVHVPGEVQFILKEPSDFLFLYAKCLYLNFVMS